MLKLKLDRAGADRVVNIATELITKIIDLIGDVDRLTANQIRDFIKSLTAIYNKLKHHNIIPTNNYIFLDKLGKLNRSVGDYIQAQHYYQELLRFKIASLWSGRSYRSGHN